jgi:GTP cyclohydrolase II
MKTQFYFLLTMKTPDGFETYGRYVFGDDREAAHALFDTLKGSEEITDAALLHIDLMETVDELPVRIKSKCCTLDELGANCKLITRELFRLNNLKGYEE